MKLGTTAKTVWLSVLGAIFAFSVSLLVGINTTANATATGITGINLSLEEDVVVKFHTDVAEGESAKLVVNFDGADTKITEHENGIFSFWGVTPQNFGKDITATLYDADGNALGETQTTSVQTYLQDLLALDLENSGCKDELQYNAMRELAVNMLNYGSAAQVYTNTDVDNLANANLTADQKELASDTITVDATDKVVVGDAWIGAGVRFDYKLGLYFVFQADDVNSINATVNGVAVRPTVYDASKNWYVIRYNDFTATNMNDVITAKLTFADASEQTFAYSVKSYVYAKGGSGDALANLVNATYVYGFAAVKYDGELKLTKAPTLTQEGELYFDNKGYDMDGTGYETVVLPALNVVDYDATATQTNSDDKAPVIVTTYTYKENDAFSFKLTTGNALYLNDTYYSEHIVSLANTDTVKYSYDATNGYVMRALEPTTVAYAKTYAHVITFIGDVTIDRGSDYYAANGSINVGTETESANVTIKADNYSNSKSYGTLTIWDGHDLHVAKNSTLTIGANKGANKKSIHHNDNHTLITVDGTMTVAQQISLAAGAGLKINKGAVVTVQSEGIAIGGTYDSATVGKNEFGQDMPLYVGGTLNVTGQIKTNRLQVGSVRDGEYGVLNVHVNFKTSDGKAVNHVVLNAVKAAAYFFFANGELNLSNVATGACALDIRGGDGAKHVDFRKDFTVNANTAIGSLVGEWTKNNAGYNVYFEEGVTLNGITGNVTALKEATRNVYFWTTATAIIDGVEKEVILLNKTPNTYTAAGYYAPSMFKYATVVDGANYVSTTTTLAGGTLGTFTQATYSDGTTNYTIYYK